jgi:hypothetical protein
MRSSRYEVLYLARPSHIRGLVLQAVNEARDHVDSIDQAVLRLSWCAEQSLELGPGHDSVERRPAAFEVEASSAALWGPLVQS